MFQIAELNLNDFFVVLSQGPGWGCVSKYGLEVMTVCSNATSPTNMTGVSDVVKCRYSDVNI